MALTLKTRGLITQSYGVQNAGTPGDLSAVASGSFTRRPQGPSLSGWTLGWSAHTSTVDTQHTFTIGSGNGEDHKCLFGAWYYFGPKGLDLGNHLVDLLVIASDYGGNETESLRINVATGSLSLASLNVRYADANGIATARRNWWVWLAIAMEDLGADNWTLKVLYREAGGGATQVISTQNFTFPGSKRITGAKGGATTTPGSGSTITLRYGLPSVYQMTVGMADAAYPSDIIEPITGPYAWYVASAAAGGGKGVLGDPWNAADLVAELGTGAFTILSGYVVDSTGATLNTDNFDADVLKARWLAGTAVHNGDIVYFDDTAGPIRPITPAVFSTCDGVRLLPLPALGRRVEIRGTTRLSSFSLDSGNIYTKAITNSYGVLFEYDSVAAADSSTGRPRWLGHPAAANVAAYRTAAYEGSFWGDGGTGAGSNVWFWPTGSGNPGSNGKVYEITTGNDILGITCRAALVKDLIIHYAATVSADNTSATDGSTGYNCRLAGDGMCIIHNCDVTGGGRHEIPMIQQTAGSTKQRNIIFHVTAGDARPTEYCGIGGQSIFVDFGSTTPLDNQWYLEEVSVPTNCAIVGGFGGKVDILQNVFTEHSANAPPNTDIPYSKGWLLNCNFPGTNTIGSNTGQIIIKDCTLGYSGADTFIGYLGAISGVTITGCTITGRSLPALQLSGGVGNTVIGNDFLLAGACVGQNWRGIIEFDGNTIYDIGLTSGGSNSLFLESGVLNLNFYGNTVKLGTVDIAIFGNGVHTQENLGWNYNEYDLPPAAVIARNYNDGSTTSDRTFTQWKALFSNAYDQNSADNSATLVSSVTYRPPVGSPAVNAVALLNVISLKGASDVGGNVRGVTGNSEAGGWLYQSGRDKGLHTKVTSFA